MVGPSVVTLVAVVLGFSHREQYQGVALMDGDILETPLGGVVLDKEAAGVLTNQSSRIFFDYNPHIEEHSAEMEVPFIQVALPKASLVVGLIGDHDATTLKELVAALTELSRKMRILVVASTDMLHDADYDLVTKTDKDTLKKVEAMDVDGLVKSWNLRNQFVCGIAPVLAAMQFAQTQGCKKGTVLHHGNSRDEVPDSGGPYIVGYGAVVFAVPK